MAMATGGVRPETESWFKEKNLLQRLWRQLEKLEYGLCRLADSDESTLCSRTPVTGLSAIFTLWE